MSEVSPVSVIVPCYNHARFLGEAIESILEQSHRPFEIVVIDDGSTDDTQQVARRYASVRYARQRNCGLAAARNAGLKNSTGVYLVFLDADDRLLPKALEHGTDSLRAYPRCGLVYGHVTLIAEDGTALPTPVQNNIQSDHYLKLLRHNYIWTTGAVMYRRDVVEALGGFNTSVSASADFDLNVRIASQFPIHCHGHQVLEYRKHGDNMSRDFGVMLKSSVRARRLHRRSVKANPQWREALEAGIRAVQKDYGEKLMAAVRLNMRSHQWRAATIGIVTLLRYNPRRLLIGAKRRLHHTVLAIRD